MSRSSRRLLVVLLGLALVTGGVLWALPEIVRRVAQDRLARATGRPVTIADVDLNLFTGRLAVTGFRLADRAGPEPFLECDRLDVRVGVWDLFRSHVRVRELRLVNPSVRVVRLGPAEFNFSDLLPQPKDPPPPPSGPSRWTITAESVKIAGGRVQVDDRAVSPPSQWAVQGLEVDTESLSTRAGAAPGQLRLKTQIDEARLVLDVEPVRLDPLQLTARLSLEGFETRRLDSYIYAPLGTPYRPKGARFGLALTAILESDAQELRKATLSGTLTLEGEAFKQVGRPDPFVSASRLHVEVKEADLIARTLTLAAVAFEGLDLTVRRDARGVIDMVEMFTPKAHTPAATQGSAPAGAAPPAAAPSSPAKAAPPAPEATSPAQPAPRRLFPVIRALAAGFKDIRIERITLASNLATFVDDAAKPPTRLVLTKLQAQLDDFTWPVKGPAMLTLSTGLPGGGTLGVKGPLTASPFDTRLTTVVRNAPVEPYQAYIPIPARLSGRYNGDSVNRVAYRDGKLVAQSTGRSWAQNVEIREPGAARPAFRVDRMELVGIDFDWPRRAAAARAIFQRLRMEVERGPDGSFNLRRLFMPRGADTGKPAPEPAPAVSPGRAPPPGPLATLHLEFREVRIDDGFVRFLDRTTEPAFSQDLSRLALKITDLGNRPDRPARLELQGIVGGDAALDIRGEIGTLGAPSPLDLVGELRSFKLPSVDPYAVPATGWAIKQGDLQYKFRIKVDGNALTAENEVVIGKLQVAPARGGDEVKRRIGLPLGMIVALIKDQNGEIRVNVPVAGAVNDPKFSFREAIWTALRNVLTNVVSAPFKAIGRLFSRGSTSEQVEEPKVDPVTFPAGSAVLSPAMEEHLLRVADFLRGTPFVNLSLAPVSNRADADALAEETVAARVQELQKERGLPDSAAALVEYYKTEFPDGPLPATREEQIARLRERVPAPAARLADLGRRRVDATRERLVTVEGIPETRLPIVAEPAAAASTETPAAPSPEATGGRVEFAIAAGE